MSAQQWHDRIAMELALSVYDSPHAPCVATAGEDVYATSRAERPGLLPLSFISRSVIHPHNPKPPGRMKTFSSPPPMSSPTRSVSSDSSSLIETPSDEAPWNLIPYDIPWGQEYFRYEAGILPGPEGDCLFLRSPTPVEKKRTSQACQMCRERRAKCSGDRPSCGRCLDKGRHCEYVFEAKRTRTRIPLRRSTRASASYHPYSRPSSSLSSASSAISAGSGSSSHRSSPYVAPKLGNMEDRAGILSGSPECPAQYGWHSQQNNFVPVVQPSGTASDIGVLQQDEPRSEQQTADSSSSVLPMAEMFPRGIKCESPPTRHIFAPTPQRCFEPPQFLPHSDASTYNTNTRTRLGDHDTHDRHDAVACIDPKMLIYSAPASAAHSSYMNRSDDALNTSIVYTSVPYFVPSASSVGLMKHHYDVYGNLADDSPAFFSLNSNYFETPSPFLPNEYMY